MTEQITCAHVEVQLNNGRTVGGHYPVQTREDLRLAIARLSALIEDELDDRLDGQPVNVEQEDPDSSTVIKAGTDVDLTLTQTIEDFALWLPNDDGFGDGSRIYADQLADTLAVINRAAAIIHERNQR